MEREILIVLKIVNRSYAEFRFEPGNIVGPGKFANQESGRKLGHRGTALKARRVGLMLGSFAEPIHRL
jgi:hypothetical protein